MECKVHYLVHKSSPLVPVVSQVNPALALSFYFINICVIIIIIISIHLRLGSPSCSFSQVSQPKPCMYNCCLPRVLRVLPISLKRFQVLEAGSWSFFAFGYFAWRLIESGGGQWFRCSLFGNKHFSLTWKKRGKHRFEFDRCFNCLSHGPSLCWK
jgi:hypothetical protein